MCSYAIVRTREAAKTAVLLALTSILLVTPAATQEHEKRVRVEKELQSDASGEGRTVVIVRSVGTATGDEVEDAQVFMLHDDAEGNEFDYDVESEAGALRWVYQTAPAAGRRGFLGVELLSLTDALRDHFASPRGVGVLISDVEEGSPAAKVGLRAADIVTAIDGEALATTHHFGRIVRSREPGTEIALEVWRAGSRSNVEVVLEASDHRVIELDHSGRIRRLEARPGERIHLDLEDATTEIREVLASGDWKTRVEHLRTIDVEALEQRILMLEAQLERLLRERRGSEEDR